MADDVIKLEPTEKTDLPLEMHPPEAGRLIVFAKNQSQMAQAQAKLVEWACAKITEKKAELVDAQKNLDAAKKSKWRTEPFKRIVDAVTKKIEFYEKIYAALQEGYTIVPNMDIDLFAIRTKRKAPKANMLTSQWGQPPANQESHLPPVGEGRYVSPEAVVNSHTFITKEAQGNQKAEYGTQRWAEDFKDVDFPFKLAKVEILEATAAAMQKLIFDEVGILPRRRVAGDPMVVGRVRYKHGSEEKAVCFCIAWFVDTNDL